MYLEKKLDDVDAEKREIIDKKEYFYGWSRLHAVGKLLVYQTHSFHVLTRRIIINCLMAFVERCALVEHGGTNAQKMPYVVVDMK